MHLLLFGANSFAASSNTLTSFLDSVRLKHGDNVLCFIDDAFSERRLITLSEHRVFRYCLGFERLIKDELDRTNEDLVICTAEIASERDRRLQTWLHARLKSAGLYEWIGRAPELEDFYSTSSDDYSPQSEYVAENVPSINIIPP